MPRMPCLGGRTDAAFRNQAGHQTGRRHVKSIVRRRAFCGREQNRDEPIVMQSLDQPDLRAVALFDGNILYAVAQLPIERGGRQGDVERHAVVAGSQGLEIRADLVGRVAGVRHAVGADDHQIHEPVLHQVTADVVCDDGMRHALLHHLPGGQARALVARPGFVHPHVHGDARVMGRVNRRRGRTVIHEGQPARVAVGQDVDRRTALALADLPDDRHPVLADAPAEVGILVGDGVRLGQRSLDPHFRIAAGGLDGRQLAVNRPLQVNGGGTSGRKPVAVPHQRRHKGFRRRLGSVQRGEVHPIAGGQRR